MIHGSMDLLLELLLELLLALLLLPLLYVLITYVKGGASRLQI